MLEALRLMRSVIDNDPTKDLIKLIRDDMERSREHDLKLMQMMLSAGNQQPTMPAPNLMPTMHHGSYSELNISHE